MDRKLNELKNCTVEDSLLFNEELIGKNQIRFKDIIIDWESMGITEEEFNSKGIRTSMEERIHYFDGRVFVYNSIHCSKNQLIEWTLINHNNLSQLEVWKNSGGDNLCYSETILYEWFGLNVQSFSIELIGTDELEKIDVDLLINELKDTNTIFSSKSHKESYYEDFDRIIIEGLIHQFKDDIDFLYENYEEEEVRRFENNSKLIRQLNELLNVRG